MFNIPPQITQGDRISWKVAFTGYEPTVDTASCFIRGQGALDLTGVPTDDVWTFEISEVDSESLLPGIYLAQFVVFSFSGRKTLGTAKIEVVQSFENLTELDTRTPEEKELAELEKAIASLSNGVAEYYIGTRRVRYHDLPTLYERQKYLRNRIARMENRAYIGGRNVGISFVD